MGKMESAKTSRRNRINFTVRQLDTMEKVFLQTQYPDVLVIEKLSTGLDIPMEKILTWFQNRRSKFRKGSQKGHINWMRQQLFSGDSGTPSTAPTPTPTPASTADATGASAANSSSTCHVLTKAPSPTATGRTTTSATESKCMSRRMYQSAPYPQTATSGKYFHATSNLQSVSQEATLTQSQPLHGFQGNIQFPHFPYWPSSYLPASAMHQATGSVFPPMSSASSGYQPISGLEGSLPVRSATAYPTTGHRHYAQQNNNAQSPPSYTPQQVSQSSSPNQVPSTVQPMNNWAMSAPYPITPANCQPISNSLSSMPIGHHQTSSTSPSGVPTSQESSPLTPATSSLQPSCRYSPPTTTSAANQSTSVSDSSPPSVTSEYHSIPLYNLDSTHVTTTSSGNQPIGSANSSPGSAPSGSQPSQPISNQLLPSLDSLDVVDVPADILSSLMSLADSSDILDSTNPGNMTGWTHQQTDTSYGYPATSYYSHKAGSDVTVGQTTGLQRTTSGLYPVDYMSYSYAQPYSHMQFS